MRFVLDECVDARLRATFLDGGHECWTVVEAGLSGEDDDEVSVYATEKDAVFVTDDRELVARRKASLFGKTLELRGSKRAPLDYLKLRLPIAVTLLGCADEIIVAVASSGATIVAPQWLSGLPED